MISGWRPKSKVVGPVPLNFDNLLVDEIVKDLAERGRLSKVIFLGFRPRDTFKMHERLAVSYRFKYEHLYQNNYDHLLAFFRKFHARFSPQTSLPFTGMNPHRPPGLLSFESEFEGGNLDCAIEVRPGVYDLFLRIDGNTNGHTQWFNFKVRNVGRAKVQFRICNLRKQNCPYGRGMRPYVLSQRELELKGQGWRQDGQVISYEAKQPNYRVLSECQLPVLYSLTFEYVFKYDLDCVQFCYCIPYEYSKLQALIEVTAKTAGQAILREGRLCESLSGLEVPLLTVTDFTVPDRGKKCVVINARTHPGESNASWMLQGLLLELVGNSAQAKMLRERIVFKIVPMLNPDGVILGNYRSSCPGKDLNRAFNERIEALYPETKALRELMGDLRREFRSDLAMFLDLHGHSLKRNVFSYGPEYRIWNSLYYKTRAFPRLLYGLSDMFRYYLSIFRISPSKVNTARAVFLKHVPHCYTIEASNCSYYGKVDKLEHRFDADKWARMGRDILHGIAAFYNQELVKDDRRRRNKSVCQPGPEPPQERDRVDAFEQGKSDSDQADEDKSKRELKRLHRSMIKSINQFTFLCGGVPPHQDNSQDWESDNNQPPQPAPPEREAKPIACMRAKSARRRPAPIQTAPRPPQRRSLGAIDVFRQTTPCGKLLTVSQLKLEFKTVSKGVELSRGRHVQSPVQLRRRTLSSKEHASAGREHGNPFVLKKVGLVSI